MQAVGRHYGAEVKLFSIWNEPNQPGFLRPQYVHGGSTSPAIYRGLFIAGYLGLRASGNFAGMKVLMGETSAVGVHPPGPGAARVPARRAVPERELPAGRALRRAAGRRLGAASLRELARPVRHAAARRRHDRHVGRLVTALDRAAAAGAVRADAADLHHRVRRAELPQPVVGVPLAQQAEFDAIGEQIAWNNPRVASFSQYLLQTTIPRRPRRRLPVGHRDLQRAPQAALQGFRLPLTVTAHDRGVALWGLVRPATGGARR